MTRVLSAVGTPRTKHLKARYDDHALLFTKSKVTDHCPCISYRCFRPKHFLGHVRNTLRDSIRGKQRLMTISDNPTTHLLLTRKTPTKFATQTKNLPRVPLPSIPPQQRHVLFYLNAALRPLLRMMMLNPELLPTVLHVGGTMDGGSWGGRPRSGETSNRRCSTRLE